MKLRERERDNESYIEGEERESVCEQRSEIEERELY